jgi:uncharacterized protein YabN with tetrapyrrole methylase and pyrophosphatase domain
VAMSIMDALKSGGVVRYVTYGNPMAYDRVAQNLVRSAKEADVRVRIVPGISSLDTVLCDLNIDMAPAIQVFETSWLVACQVQPRTDIPLLLMQVGTFGSLRTHYTSRQDGSSLLELVEHLCISYPADHVTFLVRSTGNERHEADVHPISLINLCKVTAEQLGGASLYVPALTDLQPNPDIISRRSKL